MCVKEYVCILFKTEANLLDTVIIFLLVSLTAGIAASPQTGMKGETTSTDDKIGMCPSKSKSEWWTFCYFNYHVKKTYRACSSSRKPQPIIPAGTIRRPWFVCRVSRLLVSQWIRGHTDLLKVWMTHGLNYWVARRLFKREHTQA